MNLTADLLTQIRNAQAVGKSSVLVRPSRLNRAIVNVLQKAGYVTESRLAEDEKRPRLSVGLKYDGKTPTITRISAVSRPGRRVYRGYRQFPRPLSGHGLVIVSTPQGVMSGREAAKAGLGGEIIATVW